MIMSSFSDQIEEFKSLVHSNFKVDKSLGYSALLHLQEQSNNHSSSILQNLTNNSHTLISLISIDISNDDEEIAAQALKCLGFMIYHPSIVASIPDEDASMILDALTKVIIATKIKSVCNLGVWCISMQQFNATFLASHFQSLLRAIVHALDNPFGSLSTTFEAIQVVMKFADQLSEKMREFSFIWVPPIYRRLLSNDKREKDMCERCLLKVKTTIFPPPAALSKALVKDIKWKLLTEMKDLLSQGMKVQTLQAWRWFIGLLGSHSLKNRHLINDMLKIPEQTFSDHSPQVQIASQVAWEGLIDALIHSSLLTSEASEEVEKDVKQLHASTENGCEIHTSLFAKSIKLLMTPLIGIISSKCDTSVHLSCLNTWCYLLHKLNISINHPSVIELVLTPVFKAVFEMGPDTKTSYLWSLSLDLLDDFILAKCQKLDYESISKVSHHSSVGTSMPGPPISGRCLVKQHSIKWFPWRIGQLDLFIEVINIILSHASSATITPQNRSSACNAALRLFRSLIKGIQMELKSSSITYADIMLCLNTILRFIKETCQSINSGGSGDNKLQHTSIQFLQAIIDEIEPAILGSLLYKVSLDLGCINNLQSVNDVRYEKFLGISYVAYMDMVSPLVYLIVLSFYMGIQSTSHRPRTELISTTLYKIFKVILLSYDAQENLCVAIGLLYKFAGYRNLQIWIAIAEALRDCAADVKDLSMLRMEPDSNCYLCLYHLLSYPFVTWSSPLQILTPERVSCSSEEFHIPAHGSLELEHVIEVWKSVYGALSASICSIKSFSDNLCSVVNWCIDENLSMTDCGTELDLRDKDSDLYLLSLSGNAVTCLLEEILAASSDDNKNNHAELPIFNDIKNILGFASKFLKLSSARILADPTTCLPITSRVFSALIRFTRCLHLKPTILSTIEILTCPLIQWLSHREIGDGSTKNQLQYLWAEILDCLRRSQPPIVFDSSFLKLQASLLENTLDHPDSTISELTITFWNSIYGEQIKLDYPERLLDILDKLSRNKRINLRKKSSLFLTKCNYIPELTAHMHRVTATHTGSSKRVELLQDAVNQFGHKDKFCSGSKRKRLELTEHQKEVRRAQQGRAMDCSGHGPGVRTYTKVDFSQGNEDSQDSQGIIRNPESILEMLKRVV